MIDFTTRNRSIYKKVEQWEIYDRSAGSGAYSDVDKEFHPTERYDWTLLTEIELFRNTVKGCQKALDIGCGTVTHHYTSQKTLVRLLESTNQNE